MAYVFDPIYWNGTTFLLDEEKWKMFGDWDEYKRKNLPIPASCFPETLTFAEASATLPDMFHTNRGIVVFSERARLVMEHWAPGEVEFIPVAVHAAPDIAAVLEFDSAYYFINVLGRAQRLQWLDMPTHKGWRQRDGIERFGLLPDTNGWRLRERGAGEPLVWRDTPWGVDNRRYSGHSTVFVEDAVWRALDAEFPDQLNGLRVGE